MDRASHSDVVEPVEDEPNDADDAQTMLVIDCAGDVFVIRVCPSGTRCFVVGTCQTEWYRSLAINTQAFACAVLFGASSSSSFSMPVTAKVHSARLLSQSPDAPALFTYPRHNLLAFAPPK
ncbi:hypothetical protein FIBSPDRAFT_250249 [Athelia psychrophila]|uniref:Uncharacterized protein n=1 Tax=Athelia psychrophila TaxID=1759441 RepID=A0A165XX21_9AGAM|nr:hypothetical protein FIBSPDRAFT_250249 [Fibularhizoctonia sp. CBS 109695]